MAKKEKIIIIGGDGRQKELFSLLERKSYSCIHLYDSESFKNYEKFLQTADLVILPLPVSKDGTNIYNNGGKNYKMASLPDDISKDAFVIGGMIPESLKAALDENKTDYFDFYNDEAFIVYNAYLTAQGAARLILENTKEFLTSKRVLVTGFGRVAKACAKIFSGLGMDVYIAARNYIQRNEAQCMGYNAMNVSDINSTVYIFDFIVNTVPSQIFSQKNIMTMGESAVYIELASKPFGADKDIFEDENKKYIAASSLPGRFYPYSSAKAILKSIQLFL